MSTGNVLKPIDSLKGSDDVPGSANRENAPSNGDFLGGGKPGESTCTGKDRVFACLNCSLRPPPPTHPGPQVPQEHKTERALGRIGSYGEGRRSAVQQPSLWLSPHPRTSPASFMVVCLWPHSNNGGRRSCGSSRRESSAGTTRSRCAGRRRGGARSTSRYSGARSPQLAPAGAPAPADRPWGVGHRLLGLLS